MTTWPFLLCCFFAGIDANASTSLLMLTASEHEQCINISLIEDSLVEETEALTLSLELIKNVSGIGGVEPSTTVITMRDGDCKLP